MMCVFSAFHIGRLSFGLSKTMAGILITKVEEKRRSPTPRQSLIDINKAQASVAVSQLFFLNHNSFVHKKEPVQSMQGHMLSSITMQRKRYHPKAIKLNMNQFPRGLFLSRKCALSLSLSAVSLRLRVTPKVGFNDILNNCYLITKVIDGQPINTIHGKFHGQSQVICP